MWRSNHWFVMNQKRGIINRETYVIKKNNQTIEICNENGYKQTNRMN